MEATTKSAKAAKATSTYNKGKDESMKNKVEDKSGAKGQIQPQGRKDQVCWGCGGREVHSKKARNKEKCPGKNKACHMAMYCPKDKDKSNDHVKAGKIKIGVIRCQRLKAA